MTQEEYNIQLDKDAQLKEVIEEGIQREATRKHMQHMDIDIAHVSKEAGVTEDSVVDAYIYFSDLVCCDEHTIITQDMLIGWIHAEVHYSR